MRSLLAALVLTAASCTQLPPVTFHQAQETVLRQGDQPILVAHRAKGFGGPENSMQAIEQCVANGVRSIEIDVQYTSDGVAYIMHDERIDRTTDGKGRLASYTSEQLSSYRLVNGESIPTLENVMREYAGDAMFYIDLKEQLGPAADIIAAQGALDSAYFLIKGWHNDELADVVKKYPGIHLMPRVTKMKDVEQYIHFAKEHGIEYRAFKVGTTTAGEVIQRILDEGYAVSANLLSPVEWFRMRNYLRNGVTILQTDFSRMLTDKEPVERASRELRGSDATEK